MDWEKQDNELRKLFEANEFLPENESFDSNTSWQKFRKRKAAIAPAKTRRWLPLALAACAAGLIGLLSWLQFARPAQSELPEIVSGNTGQVTTPSSTNTPNLVKQESKAPAKGNLPNAPASVTTQKAGVNAGELSKKQQVLPEVTTGQSSTQGTTQNDQTTIEETASINGSQPSSDPKSSASTAPQTQQAPPQQTMAQVAPKKPAIRVVHYNTLLASDAIAPPVFAQRSRREVGTTINEVLQTTQPMSSALKIELNPLAKKTP